MRLVLRKIAVLFFLIRKQFVTVFYTAVARFKSFCWGVEMGHNVEVSGKILIYTTNGSKISIGNNTKFRSDSLFNFRGLNHVCILQTGKKDAKIIIGDNCGFSGVSIVSDIEVFIGDNVLVGANTMIGDRDDHTERYKAIPKPVRIESNVWLGMNTVVLKGVTIGKGTIIGANSLVTKSIPSNVIAAGNPCKVIREL